MTKNLIMNSASFRLLKLLLFCSQSTFGFKSVRKKYFEKRFTPSHIIVLRKSVKKLNIVWRLGNVMGSRWKFYKSKSAQKKTKIYKKLLFLPGLKLCNVYSNHGSQGISERVYWKIHLCWVFTPWSVKNIQVIESHPGDRSGQRAVNASLVTPVKNTEVIILACRQL